MISPCTWMRYYWEQVVLDYKVFLSELSRLKDVPLMLEHLKTKEDMISRTNVKTNAASW